MADNNSQEKTKPKQYTFPVRYEPIEAPVHGCDHIIVLGTPGNSLTLQMFSTTPPVINNETGETLTENHRKCVGQFFITPTTAERLIGALTEQIDLIQSRR